MAKKLKCFRFQEDLYHKFKELCSDENTLLTEAFTKFMKACVENSAVSYPETRDIEAEARVLLQWLRNEKWWVEGIGSVKTRLLNLLTILPNGTLKRKVEAELKKQR